jgi:hypothetical protein
MALFFADSRRADNICQVTFKIKWLSSHLRVGAIVVVVLKPETSHFRIVLPRSANCGQCRFGNRDRFWTWLCQLWLKLWLSPDLPKLSCAVHHIFINYIQLLDTIYSVIWTGLAQDTHPSWCENWNSDPNLLVALIHWLQPVKENGEEGGGAGRRDGI